MKISIVGFLLCFSFGILLAQSPKAPIGKANFVGLVSETINPVPFANTITASDFEKKMNVLCSDSLRGRETGDIGQVRAGNYIASQFDAIGLEKKGDRGSYHQYFTLANSRFDRSLVSFNKTSQRLKSDWYAFPKTTPEKKIKTKRLLIVLRSGGLNRKAKNRVLLSYASIDEDALIKEAKARRAKAVILVDKHFDANVRQNRRSIGGFGWQPIFNSTKKKNKMPVLHISKEAAQTLLEEDFEKFEKAMAKQSSFKPIRLRKAMEFDLKKNETIMPGSNVFGYLEGSDPKLKKEIIAITAHYDHLGESGGVIYYGADDNASGTTGVIEIAEAFAAAKKVGKGPKRSLIFMLVSGEEKGLLGSKFYTDYPVFPMKNTITNLNTDMIGRVDDEHKDNPNYIYVIGSDRLSQELHDVNEAVNNRFCKMELDYRFNAPNDPNHFYERSDHYNFAKKGVPCIFYFNGVHADYHKPSDTIEKIDFEIAAKRAQLTFYTAWELANRANRPALD